MRVGVREVEQNNIPDRGDLSSNNLPKEIKRIELGEEGRVSQSSYSQNHLFQSTGEVAQANEPPARFIVTHLIATLARSIPSVCRR